MEKFIKNYESIMEQAKSLELRRVEDKKLSKEEIIKNAEDALDEYLLALNENIIESDCSYYLDEWFFHVVGHYLSIYFHYLRLNGEQERYDACHVVLSRIFSQMENRRRNLKCNGNKWFIKQVSDLKTIMATA